METTIQENSQAFLLKGSLFTVTVLNLLQADIELFSNQLEKVVKKAPKLFNQAPIVIDLNQLHNKKVNIDFKEIKQFLRKYGMIPIGVRGANERQQQAALEADFALFNSSNSNDTTIDIKDQPTEANTTAKSKIITNPVRSGQQVYANGGDLIVLASVSHGAELLADGNIHVYGALRGRALAGIQGNANARIFCQCLEAELVSIAGHFITNETSQLLMQKSPQQIYLQDEKLNIKPL